jgi:hypothetical protein
MFAKLHQSLKIAGVAAALAAASSPGMAFDPLRASVERMLADGPVAARPVAVPAGPADPLLAAIVLPLRDGTKPAGAEATDPVVESFARMLRHEPSRHLPPLPQGAGADPLIAAVVLPLLRANPTLVAGAKAQRPH